MRRTVNLAIAAALVVSACAVPTNASGTTVAVGEMPTTIVDHPHPGAARALMPFDACDDLLDWSIGHALERVGPYGIDGYGGYPVLEEAVGAPSDGRLDSARVTASAVQKDSVIGTNLQEAGVDEPDLVKTDGERIVAVSGSRLFVLTIEGDRLTLEGSIDLGFWTEDLFLDGDRVIAIADGGYDLMPFQEDLLGSEGLSAPIYSPSLTVGEIDISDTGDPELTRMLR